MSSPAAEIIVPLADAVVCVMFASRTEYGVFFDVRPKNAKARIAEKSEPPIAHPVRSPKLMLIAQTTAPSTHPAASARAVRLRSPAMGTYFEMSGSSKFPLLDSRFVYQGQAPASRLRVSRPRPSLIRG